jgi:hypothetical protein
LRPTLSGVLLPPTVVSGGDHISRLTTTEVMDHSKQTPVGRCLATFRISRVTADIADLPPADAADRRLFGRNKTSES